MNSSTNLSAEDILLAHELRGMSQGRMFGWFKSIEFLSRHVEGQIRFLRQDPVRDFDWEAVPGDQVNGAADKFYVRVDPTILPSSEACNVIDEGLPRNRNRIGSIWNEDAGILELRSEPIGNLQIVVDISQYYRQRDAINRWHHRPHPDRSEFFNYLVPLHDATWRPVHDAELLAPLFLTDPSRPGTEQQLEFVKKALGTPDFAVLHGPPGSGKTTAICELISQLVRRGQRVMLCGMTHESIDNVLERLVDRESDVRDVVLPIRVGNNPEKMSPIALDYHIDHLSWTIRRGARDRLAKLAVLSLAQEHALAALSHDASEIDAMIIRSANVVCGTPTGVTRDPRFEPYFRTGEPVFDVLIIDEASKLDMTELMYAGLLARRWILSGDPFQLPPHSTPENIFRQLKIELGLPLEGGSPDLYEDVNDTSQPKHDTDALDFAWEVAMAVETRFQYRMMPESRAFISAQAKISTLLQQLDPDEAETWETAITSVEHLLMRSVIEAMITPRQTSDGFHGSAFTAAVDVGIPEPHLSARSTLLTYQHRMHPEISVAPREEVYRGSALLDPPDMTRRRTWSYGRYGSRAIFIDTLNSAGNARGSGRKLSDREWRRTEAAVAETELRAFVEWSDTFQPHTKVSVALITFYTDMRNELKSVLRNISGSPVEADRAQLGAGGQIEARVGTVESFQGREADLVILCVGRDRITSFSGSINRCNVAITRARYQLVIVGNREVFARQKTGRLLEVLARTLPSGDLLGGRE